MSDKIGNIFLRFKKDGETERKVHLVCSYRIPEEMREKYTDNDVVEMIKKAVESAKKALNKVSLPYCEETCAKFLFIDFPLAFWDLEFVQNTVEVLCDHLYYIEVEADGYDRSFSLRGYNVTEFVGKKSKVTWMDLYLLPDAYQKLSEEFDLEVEAVDL